MRPAKSERYSKKENVKCAHISKGTLGNLFLSVPIHDALRHE
jgi:hypothetical protein